MMTWPKVYGNRFCLMSVSDKLQESNTRGQLSLTESSMRDAQSSAPGLWGIVIMSNSLFKKVKCAFFLEQYVPEGHLWMTYLLILNLK